MKIKLTTVFVNDQDKALRFYTEVLGFAKKTWKQMGDLGWLGVLYPESAGGFGGSFVDAALVLEQLGTQLVPEPYLASVILGGMALCLAGSDEQRERFLARAVVRNSRSTRHVALFESPLEIISCFVSSISGFFRLYSQRRRQS